MLQEYADGPSLNRFFMNFGKLETKRLETAHYDASAYRKLMFRIISMNTSPTIVKLRALTLSIVS